MTDPSLASDKEELLTNGLRAHQSREEAIRKQYETWTHIVKFGAVPLISGAGICLCPICTPANEWEGVAPTITADDAAFLLNFIHSGIGFHDPEMETLRVKLKDIVRRERDTDARRLELRKLARRARALGDGQ